MIDLSRERSPLLPACTFPPQTHESIRDLSLFEAKKSQYREDEVDLSFIDQLRQGTVKSRDLQKLLVCMK